MTRTADWLSAGWRTVISAPGHFLLLSFLWALVIGIVSGATDGALVLLIIGPARASLYGVVLARVRTGQMDFDRLRVGIDSFIQTMLAGLVIAIFTAAGLVILLLPGLLIASLYLFSILLIIDRGMSFWEAMEESRKKVQQDLIGFLGFFLALVGINLLGLACFGVGFFLTLPVALAAVSVAYRELWPEEAPAAEQTPPADQPQLPQT